MKALIYNPDSNLKLDLVDIEKPKLNSNSAIISIKGVGVCGSDLVKINQGLVSRGAILGHEMVGIIDEISSEMSQKYNLQKGDRIVSSHHVPCLECKFCLNQQESLCETFKKTNFNPGAFCEYLELSEAHLRHTVLKIPEHISFEQASFTEPLACCIKAIERSGIKNYNGQSKILILGLGSIGLLIAQLLRYYRPGDQLHCFDISQSRIDFAQKQKFETVLEDNYDFIFLCAGANASVETAMLKASRGATLLVFASTPDFAVGFANNEIYYKELTVLGSYSPNLVNLKESLELIASHKIQVKELITHRTNLENLPKTIIKSRDEQGMKIFVSLL